MKRGELREEENLELERVVVVGDLGTWTEKTVKAL